MGHLYRTVSYAASCVLTGSPRLILKITGVAIKTAEKKSWPTTWGRFRQCEETVIPRDHVETETMRKWQSQWNNSPTGTLTKKLVQKVGRKVPELDFYAVSRHGCFRSYLLKFERVEHQICQCREADEAPLHIRKECRLCEDGSSHTFNWQEPESIQYMDRIVRRLWKIEREETYRGVGNLPLDTKGTKPQLPEDEKRSPISLSLVGDYGWVITLK
jgi:hypothetical protein